MTKLGEMILKTLQERASKSMQSPSAAIDASSIDLRNKLEIYFKNIIPLPLMNPDEGEYRYIESLFRPPSPSELAELRAYEMTMDVNSKNNFDADKVNADMVLFTSQTTDEVNAFERPPKPTDKKPSNIKREPPITTAEDWENMQAAESTKIAQQIMDNAIEEREKFHKFISNCMQAENLPQLVKIVETIEQITRENSSHLSLIGDLLAGRDLVVSDSISANRDSLQEDFQLRSLYEADSTEFDDYSAKNTVPDSTINDGLLTALNHTDIAEDIINYILELCTYIMQNPRDLEKAAALADIVNTYVISRLDKDSYTKDQNNEIEKYVAPFQEINPISELLKIRLAAPRKQTPSLIHDFFELKGKKRFADPSLEYLAIPTKITIPKPSHRKKNLLG